MLTAAIFLCAFLLGSVPTGYLIGRLHGVDLRATGSGNIGATNALRTLGKKAGIFTLLGDVLKGVLAVLLGRYFLSLTVPLPSFPLHPLVGLTAILGHCYSPFLKGNGGKGVATSLGVFLLLSPLSAAVAILTFAMIVTTSRIVSLASLFAAWALVLSLFVNPDTRSVISLVVAGISAAFVITLRHRENIRRLVAGNEKRLGQSRTGEAGVERAK